MDLGQSFRKDSVWPSPTLEELMTGIQMRHDSVGDDMLEAEPSEVIQVRDTASPPLVLSFNNLTYSVKTGRKMSPTCTKSLISDISGEARDGQILAVLGDSGSGKSTLIDALANRIAKGSLKGSLTLNGEALDSRLLKTISTYVMQDDLLYPMLTVEETLTFSAEFRLPPSLSKYKKKARVQALIDQLGLRAAAKTVIGDEGHRGVSGGERRRVSIGIDIIHDPILLFLDEPTSGLDSTSAFMVVNVLKSIAQTGSIVVMSIHQPSYRILSLLNCLIILSHGQTVYTGSPSNLPRFFAEFGRPVPENENVAEFSLDLIKDLGYLPDGTKSLVEFNKSWQQKTKQVKSDMLHLSLNDAITASLSKGKLVSNSASSVSTFVNPSWVEFAVLSKRSILNSKRMPELFGIKLAAALVTGLILATMFWRLDTSASGIRELSGFFSFFMTTVFFTCGVTLPALHQERYIFMRETAYNAYRRSSYVMVHSILSVPPTVVLSAVLASTTFWSVGLSGGGSGFVFLFLTILASYWAGTAVVSFIAVSVSNLIVSQCLMISLLAYFLLVCGSFISRDRIPAYWSWLHYISLVKYPYEALLRNEFLDPVKCFVKGIQVFDDTQLATVPDEVKLRLLKTMGSALGMNVTADTCITTGVDILKRQGISEFSKWNSLLITVAWGFFYRILFYLALLFGTKNKRR